ncbi:sensor histidine kinase [Rhizorhabdus dicambivorans]|uniref:sensor histidine kinase n=1 Tax=Rhizorhabdus dicambivorans TaxID=1850238 RepID=UPI0008367457|nr:histidine kinase dimerization/phosphoacceptor domain -containing protein [Rhizorhabdus dicambivorans]
MTGPVAIVLERFPLARERPALGYAATLGIIAVALTVRFLADPLMPAGYPYVAFFPAVILSTFLFGVGPGIVAGVICGLSAWYFFMPPQFSAKMTPGIAFALIFYGLVVAIDIVLIAWMQRSNRRLARERERSRQLAERGEVLFRELQHRVSNNLQVVGGLLALQIRSVSDSTARAALEESSRRLALIGRIHRQLYDPHGEQLDLGAFLSQLGGDLIDSCGKPAISCRIEAEPGIHLPAQAAVPIALIVAEAVANAIEHGFAAQDEGEILVEATTADGTLRVTVLDDGVGLPAGFDLAASDSLGLRLAQMLARQLGGTFSLEGGQRTTAKLTLPITG